MDDKTGKKKKRAPKAYTEGRTWAMSNDKNNIERFLIVFSFLQRLFTYTNTLGIT